MIRCCINSAFLLYDAVSHHQMPVHVHCCLSASSSTHYLDFQFLMQFQVNTVRYVVLVCTGIMGIWYQPLSQKNRTKLVPNSVPAKI